MWVIVSLVNVLILSLIGALVLGDLVGYYEIIGISIYLMCCGYSPSSRDPVEMSALRLQFYCFASLLVIIWLIYGNIG